ncbi:MAG: flagellar export protein FliJ [Bryobacteraceae bacterium]
MKRFVFRLESVLRWRRGQLEQEQNRLQAMAAGRDAIRRRLEELERMRREAEACVLSSGGVSGSELAALEAFRRKLAAERARWQRELEECEHRIQAQREAVLEARRRVRLLERLKERRHEEWEADVAKELETLATESYLARWGRS